MSEQKDYFRRPGCFTYLKFKQLDLLGYFPKAKDLDLGYTFDLVATEQKSSVLGEKAFIP